MRAEQSRRLIGLDGFRIALAILTFLFHSRIHIFCNYGILNSFISMGAIAMTGFFVLSGYSLYYSYSDKDLHNIRNVRKFYLKRCIGILPNYYVVTILYSIFLGTESVMQNLVLIPTEVLCIQAFFSSLFKVTCNSGTWFVSCILLCYLVFPFLLEMVKQSSAKGKIGMAFLAVLILLYAPFVVYIFEVQSIYSNPFFRILEFMIGVILASDMEIIHRSVIVEKVLGNRRALIAECIILILGISTAYILKISQGNYMLYSWIALPLFLLMLITLTFMKFEKTKGNIGLYRAIQYISNISYSFFLAQFFVWPVLGGGNECAWRC